MQLVYTGPQTSKITFLNSNNDDEDSNEEALKSLTNKMTELNQSRGFCETQDQDLWVRCRRSGLEFGIRLCRSGSRFGILDQD